MVGENVHIHFDVLFQCVLFNLLDSCNMFHSWRYPGFAYAPESVLSSQRFVQMQYDTVFFLSLGNVYS